MSAERGRQVSQLENIEFYFEVVEKELPKQYPNFYTLASSFEQILINTEKVISTDSALHHKNSSCPCLQKIQELFPWMVSKERQIRNVIRTEVETGDECWLIKTQSIFTLLRMWFQRMQ